MGLFSDLLKAGSNQAASNEEMAFLTDILERSFKEMIVTEYNVERDDDGEISITLKFKKKPEPEKES
jgi:hypothetical protein